MREDLVSYRDRIFGLLKCHKLPVVLSVDIPGSFIRSERSRIFSSADEES
jgi:hypothetical protein